MEIINYLGNYKTRKDELMFETCPFCHGGQHKDKWKFFVNPIKGTYYCQRGKCNEYGHISQLFKHFGLEYKKDGELPVKKNNSFKGQKMKNKEHLNLNTFKFNLLTENDEGFKYLNLRKIRKKTIDYFGIGRDEKGNILFPFHQKTKLVCLKYRIPRKPKKGQLKTWQSGNGKEILFNYDNINFTKPLFITEGEIDCMSIYQAGFENVCSIPFGTNNFNWVDLHWEDLKKVPSFIICQDNDEAGKKLLDECILKLGIDRIRIIDNPYKDINEFLYRENHENLFRLLSKSHFIDIDGLIEGSEIGKYKIDKKNRIDSGIQKLNNKSGGFLPGQLVIITGKRGNGKSTIASQFIIEAINKDISCCVYSGELTKELFKNWLFLQILGESIGLEYDELRGKQVEIVPDKYWSQLNDWIKNKLYIYDNSVLDRKSLKEASILKVFQYAARRHNCKLFLLDNLMSARKQYDTGRDFYKRQGEFIGEFKDFANDYKITVLFVVHPRKTDNKADFKNDDVAGSSEISDRADLVYILQRLDLEEQEKYNCKTLLHITKNRLFGEEGTIKLDFFPKCKQFVQAENFPKKYIDLKVEKTPEVNLNNLEINNNLPWEV